MLLEEARLASPGVPRSEVVTALEENLDAPEVPVAETEDAKRRRIARENQAGHEQLLALAGMAHSPGM